MVKGKKEKRTAEDAGFFQRDYDILENVNIGETMLRLVCLSNKAEIKHIQLWSNMSKQWNVMYRYNVDEAWSKWKKTAESISSRRKK